MLQSLKKLFTPQVPQDQPFDSAVAIARQPHWYRAAAVPDTVDGRFRMLATILALVIVRLERGDGQARRAAVQLTERFIAEMDGEVRQMGIGDPGLAKQVGRMVGALGGRVGRFREVITTGGEWTAAVRDGLYGDAAVEEAALAHAVAAVGSAWRLLDRASDGAVIAGEWG